MTRDAAVHAALLLVLLEGNLLLSILFYPDFRENLPVWSRIAPVRVVREMIDTIGEAGFVAYLAAQQFFKAANTLGTAAAALLAAGAVAREVDNRTIEFLLSRPTSRRRILLSRFSIGALALALPVFLSSASAAPLAAILPRVEESVAIGRLLLASAHCSLFLVTIYAVAFLLSTILSDPGRVALFVLGGATLSFALYLVNDVTHYSIYRLSDVPTYLGILLDGRLPWRKDLLLAGAGVLLVVAADRVFHRRDF